MANFIVKAFRYRTLKKLPILNRRKYTSLGDAKNIAFVFNSQEKDIAEAIELLKARLKVANISYRGFGISFTKDESTNTKLDHDPYIVQILKKETNWLSIPQIEQAENFYKGEYDILFDLSLDHSFAIEYSLKRCTSNMVVGFCPEREYLYDICITDKDGEINPNTSVVEYVKHAIQYLTIIKSK